MIKICKRICYKTGGVAKDIAKILEDPIQARNLKLKFWTRYRVININQAENKHKKAKSLQETKKHIVGTVGRRQLIGIEEIVLHRSNRCTKSAICSSTEGAEL